MLGWRWGAEGGEEERARQTKRESKNEQEAGDLSRNRRAETETDWQGKKWRRRCRDKTQRHPHREEGGTSEPERRHTKRVGGRRRTRGRDTSGEGLDCGRPWGGGERERRLGSRAQPSSTLARVLRAAAQNEGMSPPQAAPSISAPLPRLGFPGSAGKGMGWWCGGLQGHHSAA